MPRGRSASPPNGGATRRQRAKTRPAIITGSKTKRAAVSGSIAAASIAGRRRRAGSCTGFSRERVPERSGDRGPARQFPAGPDEVAGIAVRDPLQIILMLGLGLPEIAGGYQFRHHFSGPEPRRVDIGDRVQGDFSLRVAGIEDRRAVARAAVVALAVLGRRVVDLEEEFQQRPEIGLGRIEQDLDCFGVVAVIAIGRVRHLAAGISDPGGDHAGISAYQILHTPETAAGENGTILGHRISSAWVRAGAFGGRALEKGEALNIATMSEIW